MRFLQSFKSIAPIALTALTLGLFPSLLSTLPLNTTNTLNNLHFNLLSVLSPTAQAAPRRSRLSGLIKSTPNLYLPTRFLIGEEQTILVKAPVGNKVVVFISPQSSGYPDAPNGLDLNIGPDVERMEAVTNAKGVARLTLSLPNNKEMAGHHVFIDGYTHQQTDGSDAIRLSWMDPTGRRTGVNSVQLAIPSDGTGTQILPGMPGIGGDMLRRIGTMQDIRKGGERMKGLVDDGSRTDSIYDRNTFTQRPDGTGGI